MAATTVSASSTPPTTQSSLPAFSRIASASLLTRNASTSSSRSTTTSESSSSLVAVPIRPPPIQTRTAATPDAQLPDYAANRPPLSTRSSDYGGNSEPEPGAVYGGRGFLHNGPRMARQATMPFATPPAIITSSSPKSPSFPLHANTTPRSASVSGLTSGSGSGYTSAGTAVPGGPGPMHGYGYGSAGQSFSPTTPKASGVLLPFDAGASPGQIRRLAQEEPHIDLLTSHSLGAAGSTPTVPRSGSRSTVQGVATSMSSPPSPLVGPRNPSLARNSSDEGHHIPPLPPTDAEHSRRQSQASNHSTASANRRPSLRDYILGEELGRGSYSTVVHATLAPNSSMGSSRAPRQFAIKIMNQAHLVQEKKIKYAHIERDALIRLSMPRASASPTIRHRRGVSGSSSHTAIAHKRSTPNLGSGAQRRRDSNNSTSMPLSTSPRLVLDPASGPALMPPLNNPVSHSPLATVSTLPSSDADQGEVLADRAERSLDMTRSSGRPSHPPSPVKEEAPTDITGTPRTMEPASIRADHQPNVIARPIGPTNSTSASMGPGLNTTPGPHPPVHSNSTGSNGPSPVEPHVDGVKLRTPRKRRESGAPSDRSVKSAGGSHIGGHPGVIRLYCTFADKTSVYYVLELASNGELAAVIRKFGSLALESARYYSAQLIDTIEFIHERDVIHRDLKPENILLDDDNRIKVTDFGSAKLLDKNDETTQTSKRSFVGSADYVSPEVLRNEPASMAADIWAFGVVLYDFLVGKPPFRSATEYLTFQKVLSRDLQFPEGFDENARHLIDWILDLDPTKRPTAQAIKSHPFFATIDWSTIWTIPAPQIETGLSPPVKTLAHLQLDSDVWTAFDDDGSSDDDLFVSGSEEGVKYQPPPQFNQYAAANAIEAVDHPGLHLPSRQQTPGNDDLNPPRRAWLDEGGVLPNMPQRCKKGRGWSTSSSSSGGRLSGLLDVIGINPPFTPPRHSGSIQHSQVISDDHSSGLLTSSFHGRSKSPDVNLSVGIASDDNRRWGAILLPNERVVLCTPVIVKASNTPLPSFLTGAKKRQLILTDFPRLVVAKDDPQDGQGPRLKHEFVFLGGRQGVTTPSSNDSPSQTPTDDSSSSNVIIDVQEKSTKTFIVQTATQSFTFATDTADIRSAWLHTLSRVVWPRWSPTKRPGGVQRVWQEEA